jgi:hypothetical protein
MISILLTCNVRQWKDLASSAGLSMGFSLRINFFPPPDSSGEMPAEEARKDQLWIFVLHVRCFVLLYGLVFHTQLYRTSRAYSCSPFLRGNMACSLHAVYRCRGPILIVSLTQSIEIPNSVC